MRNLIWFLLGIMTGAILATLYAPDSGKKTRKKLKKQAKRLQLEMELQTEKSKTQLNDWKIAVEELAENAVKKMNGNEGVPSSAV